MRNTSLITPWRLKWYSVSILFAIFSALLIVLSSGIGPRILSGRLGGDLPVFYAAGRMAAKWDFNHLYDLDKQIDAQKDLYPDHHSYMPIPYPPYIALACIPLSYLPYRIAYILNLAINFAAFFIAFICLKKIVPISNEFFLPAFTLSLTFYPFLKAILNGQLTAITFMLFALSWKLSSENKHYTAGIWMGLLIFKPQFAIPVTGLFLLSGRLKTAATSIITMMMIISFSLIFTGIQTYAHWFYFLKWFSRIVHETNGYNAVSWIGFMDAICGPENRITSALGYAFCFVTVLTVSYIWTAGGTRSDLNAQMGIAAVSFVLIPSYMLYYDSALIVLSYAVILPKINNRKIELICFVWLMGLTQLFAEKWGFSPLFFLVVFTFIASLYVLFKPAAQKSFTTLQINCLH